MILIDADALTEKCGDWYVEEGTESGFIGTLKNLLATEPTIQPEKAQLSCEGTTSDTISRQAVKYLDLFTKTYCRDKSATDDLVFRCSDCEFELRPSGKCLVKCMARKLCPDYKDFGSMGDL